MLNTVWFYAEAHLINDFKGGITDFSTFKYTSRRDDYSSRYLPNQCTLLQWRKELKLAQYVSSHDYLIIVDHRTYIFMSLGRYHSLPWSPLLWCTFFALAFYPKKFWIITIGASIQEAIGLRKKNCKKCFQKLKAKYLLKAVLSTSFKSKSAGKRLKVNFLSRSLVGNSIGRQRP